MLTSNNSILALDVGEKRIGVARANAVARIASPLTTLANTADFSSQLQALLAEHDAAALVVGLPRGLEGQHTKQTAVVEAFMAALQSHVTIPVYWQDEALTSHKAKAELSAKGGYRKEAVDALAATYILEDFLREHPEVSA